MKKRKGILTEGIRPKEPNEASSFFYLLPRNTPECQSSAIPKSGGASGTRFYLTPTQSQLPSSQQEPII